MFFIYLPQTKALDYIHIQLFLNSHRKALNSCSLFPEFTLNEVKELFIAATSFKMSRFGSSSGIEVTAV